MKTVVKQFFLVSLCLSICCVDLPVAGAQGASSAESNSVQLKLRNSVQLPELAGANRLVLTNDGRHLFCAAWRGSAIVGFDFDSDGDLVHSETVRDAALQGAIKLCLNRDNTRLACICLRSNRVVLFSHVPKTGELSLLGSSEADLEWPVAIEFSPDSRFLYVADAGGSGTSTNAESELVTFGVVGGKSIVEVSRDSPDQCLGMRNLIISEDGEHCYACCSSSGCILVFARDSDSGRLTFLQSIGAQTSAATLLAGIHSATFSHDQARVYCISGRFMGRSGVTVFHRLRDGRLVFARELALESDQFSGGNDIAVSRDESLIVASATKSSTLAVIDQNLQMEKLALQFVIEDEAGSRLLGASGLLLNPSEKKLYVASEDGSAVSTLDVVYAPANGD